MDNPQKPSKDERHEKIKELITSKPHIKEQSEIRKELEKHFGVGINQSDVSKDFAKLGIQKLDDGSFTIEGTRPHNVRRLKALAKECEYSSSDVCTEFKTLVIKSRNLAYSHMLSRQIKEMYPEIIIDAVCGENSVVVYYEDKPVFRQTLLSEDIKAHFPS
jgi:arginine repressor